MGELYFFWYKLLPCDQCLLRNTFKCEHEEVLEKNIDFSSDNLVSKMKSLPEFSNGRRAFLVISISIGVISDRGKCTGGKNRSKRTGAVSCSNFIA